MKDPRDTICAEIEYIDADSESRHSDIGPRAGSLDFAHAEYRQFLHENLDEWLDKSNGTGIFYITGEPKVYLKGADAASDTYAIEKILNDRIDHLSAEIDQLKRQLTSSARDHGAGGYWQKKPPHRGRDNY